MQRIYAAVLICLFTVSGLAQFTNVSVGTAANDGTGDSIRAAMQKLNFADNWLKTNLTTVSNLVGGGNATKLETNYTTANLISFGAVADNSLSDDLALTNALAGVSEVIVPKGTFNFSTNIVIGSGKRVRLEAGAILKPASGIIIEFTGELDGPQAQCIDESAGGRVIFSDSTRTKEINGLWWGASNLGSADATTALRAWLYSGKAAINVKHYLPPGTYLVSDELVLSNRVRITGAGSAGTGAKFFGEVGANKAILVVKSGANDVHIDDLMFVMRPASGTNSNAIRIEDDCDFTNIRNCRFQDNKGFAIYSAGSPSLGNLYTYIADCHQLTGNNSVAAGGNGLWPSGFFHSTNVFSASTFARIKIATSDMGFLFHGGTTTNSGNITLEDVRIEGCGGSGYVYATNMISGHGISQLNIITPHVENNYAHNDVYLINSKGFYTMGGVWGNDFSGTVKVTNTFYFDSVFEKTIQSARLNNCFSNYVVNINSGGIPVHLNATFFDLGTHLPTTEANAFTRIVGDYMINGFYRGNGSPESVVTATVGKIYQRADGGANTSFYVKESGTGNTGWVAGGGGGGGTSVYVGSTSVSNPSFQSDQFGINTSTNIVLKEAATITNVVNSGVVTLTDGATVSTDASLGHTFQLTLGGNRQLAAPSNGKAGQFIRFAVIQDGTGSRTLTLSTNFLFGDQITQNPANSGGYYTTARSFSTTANTRSYFGAFCRGNDLWDVLAGDLTGFP